jgi:hypothetical protein
MKLCPSIEFWLGQDIIVSYVKVSPGHYFIEIAIWNSVLDTITYKKVSGGHFELEDTIKCYILTVNIEFMWWGLETGKRTSFSEPH